MSSSDEGAPNSPPSSILLQKKYKGVRRRKWGKWVSEIRVPGTQERLWLGTYVSPEAAAVAHDIAYYCLRERTSLHDFNFPLVLPAGVQRGMSPRSVQRVATDAGMAIDAQLIANPTAPADREVAGSGGGGTWSSSNDHHHGSSVQQWEQNGNREDDLNVSVDDYL